MVRLVRDYFNSSIDLSSINETDLVLVPKINDPEVVSHYRPICLCNICCKVILKMTTNRMKIILPKITLKNQRVFISRRLIHDNILIAHEAFHYLKGKKKGRKYEMAVKIDMSKAYDRLE